MQKTHATFQSGALKLLLLVAAMMLVTAGSARAWWDKEWTVRKQVTVNTSGTGGAISAPIGGAAVLLRLHDGNFQFASAKEDGSDIRLVAGDEKTLLPFHIEKFDPLFNEAFVWVKIPDIKPDATTPIWLYYGNSGPKATSIDNPNGTYDDDTVLVYHFSEHGAPAKDSTKNSNNAQNTAAAVDASQIGAGIRFDGQNNVTVAQSPSLLWNAGASFTISAWVKPAAPQPNAVVVSRSNGAARFVLGLDNGNPFVEVADGGASQRSAAGQPLAPAVWHHLAAVAGSGTITIYVDGDQYATLNAPIPALDAPLVLGNRVPAGADASTVTFEGSGLTGEMDEFMISRVARPAGYIKLLAAGQAGGDKGDKLVAMGADEQTHSFLSDGYIGVIIGSLTADGWVVIGLLAVMGVISWWVMISKAGYLNSVKSGNERFLKEWSHVASDLSALDQDLNSAKALGGRMDAKQQRALRNSSVYRIYHIGVEEIGHRLREDQIGIGGERVLSARSIQAIRASLDGGLVRETQRLNSGMVLLTIAISGGPFLGLLGTVVGVMITFAAVAAAGDVNVNAIAPGIAAALAATVAGLGVAIPSLFGYNYLLTRVKEATSDMHVFIDEFVTKMAEYYCESETESAH